MTRIIRKFRRISEHEAFRAATLLAVRIGLAAIFFLSGRTKVEEGTLLTISDTTYFLFEEEYAAVPLPSELAAPMATYAEHLFPVLLVIGLMSRLSAAALLGMTLVIQIFVYPDAFWNVHLGWIALALAIISFGPGPLALDRFLADKFKRA